MSAVFISYRRGDSSGHTGRLYDHLYKKLGKEYVFMDIDTIEPGMDFVEAIDKEIKLSAVLLVVIGDEWLTASDEHGRRLDDPNDFIRIEISSALRRKLRIIPVLVKGAKMPTADELPDDIAALSRRHALELSDTRWDYDINRLLTTLADTLEKSNDSKEEAVKTDTEIHAKKENTIDRDKSDRKPVKPHGKTNNSKRFFIPVLAISLVATLLIIYWQSRPVTREEIKEITSSGIDEKVIESGTTELEKSLPPDRDVIPPQSDKDKRIEHLIDNANKDIKEFRLTSPTENNALEKYKQILELEPEHPAAIEGINKVAEKYISLARTALRKGQLDKAEQQLEQANNLNPATKGLKKLDESIAARRQEIRENQQTDRTRKIQKEAEYQEKLLREKEARKEALLLREKEAKQQDHRAKIELETCLKDCDEKFQACQGRQTTTSFGCESEIKAECEEKHQACLNDPQVYILFGEFGTDAECNGRMQKCIDQQSLHCKEQVNVISADCESMFSACNSRCR